MARSGFSALAPLVTYLAYFTGSYCFLVAFVAAIPSISYQFTSLVTHAAAVLLSSVGFVADVYPQAAHIGYAEIRFNSTRTTLSRPKRPITRMPRRQNTGKI